MRQLGFLIMASTLPLGITTRKAVQLLPFPHIGTSYRYSTITKLLEAGFMEERHVTVAKDHRPYENTYLSLTFSGLCALVQYAGNHPVEIGRVVPGAIGYDFLHCIDTDDPGQVDGEVQYQRQSNAGIASLLHMKETEAFLQSAGVAAFPLERPDLGCILQHTPQLGNAKAPTMIGAIVLSAVQRWLRSHPRQSVTIDRSIPMWFSSRDIKAFVDGPASSHHDFANYDGIILLADRYITFYHAGMRGTAWNAKANKRLLSYTSQLPFITDSEAQRIPDFTLSQIEKTMCKNPGIPRTGFLHPCFFPCALFSSDIMRVCGYPLWLPITSCRSISPAFYQTNPFWSTFYACCWGNRSH